jgi:transcriptional regulator with XRE-family HTH domain
MPQTTIGQRIKFLIDSEKISVRKFAQTLDVAETNIRNYLDKGTKPSSDALEKMVRSFPRTNLVWLVTGEGEPFLSESDNGITQTGNFNQAGTSNKQVVKGNKGNLQTGDNSTINNLTLANCKTDLEKAQREIEYLRGQLLMQETVLAAKEETITLLRASFNRPN